MPVNWPEVLLSPPAALLGAMAFAPFGLFAIAATLVVKQALTGVSIVLTLLAIFAGVYFPVRLLPDSIQWLSEVQPFTPAVELLRHLISGAPTSDPPLTSALKLALWAAVMLPASVWALERAVAYSRRRGTIIEY
jgi:ABC-type polysaccharide/polyol phosphate export permease